MTRAETARLWRAHVLPSGIALALVLLSCSPAMYKTYGPKFPAQPSGHPIDLITGEAPPFAEIIGELSYSYSRRDRPPTVEEALEGAKQVGRDNGADALSQVRTVQRDQSGLFYVDVFAKAVRYPRDAAGRPRR